MNDYHDYLFDSEVTRYGVLELKEGNLEPLFNEQEMEVTPADAEGN